MIKYKYIDPKFSDLTIIRINKSSNGLELVIETTNGALNHQIDGKILKLFLPSKYSNIFMAIFN